jgi:aryl-alcohol dehydrogenase-like predicted oxidoreductase
VSIALVGFTNNNQIEENLKALELYKMWNKDIEKKCRDILNNDSKPDMDFNTWSDKP